jgi:hypothetical protein
LNSECDSALCNTQNGTCVSGTTIAYASPSGSSNSACTQSDPCTLTRALAVVDATRNNIVLAPGTYTTTTAPALAGGFTINVYGPGTIVNPPNVRSGTTLHLSNLSVQGTFDCRPTSVGAAMPTLDLFDVDVTSTQGIIGFPCVIKLRRVRVSGAQLSPVVGDGETAGVGGATVNRGSVVTIDQSVLEGPDTDPPVLLRHFSSVQIANSVLRGGPLNTGAINFDQTTLASTVSFSTFYNATLVCPNSAAILTSRNNVYLNERANPPANTVANSSCVHYYDLIKPQATAPGGANNILNQDPRFANGANGDFHLIVGSPAIDAADPTASEPIDLEGTTRPQGAARDIGAFEYKP